MKLSDFQDKVRSVAKLHNDLNMDRQVNEYRKALDRGLVITKLTNQNQEIWEICSDVSEATYLAFIQIAFEMAMDVVTIAMTELKFITPDKNATDFVGKIKTNTIGKSK